jgi:solute carrier family 45 protein 1/2/4
MSPLCGVILPPYLGILSDRCQWKLGRRRPFIVVGATGSILCMLGLASTKSIWHFLASLVNADIHGAATRSLVLISAVFWFFGLNIFIQPLQSGTRALIVDCCVAEEQVRASAWASRMAGVGSIVGYFFGFVPLQNILPSLDITQFSWLCLVASLTLATTVILTCLFIKEQDPRSLPAPVSQGLSFWATVRHIIWSATTMPETVRQVCQVQFFAWLGWFPYLFYISSFVGDLCMFKLLCVRIASS